MWQAVFDEALLEGNLHALIGVVTTSGNDASTPGQAMVSIAFSNLAQMVDTCSGADFLQLTRRHGVLIEVS